MSYWCQEYFTFSLNLLNVSFKSLSSWWAFLSEDSLLKRATLALRFSRYIDSCFTCFIQKYKSMFLHQERIRKKIYKRMISQYVPIVHNILGFVSDTKRKHRLIPLKAHQHLLRFQTEISLRNNIFFLLAINKVALEDNRRNTKFWAILSLAALIAKSKICCASCFIALLPGEPASATSFKRG